MKKVICLVLAILVCASLAAPALADAFVPSITYKGTPDVDTAVSESNQPLSCVNITSVAEAKKDNTEENALLVKLYDELVDGTTDLPYEKIEGIDAEKMVIRELILLSCTDGEDHGMATVTLDLGVAADVVVVVMSYENGEWVPVADVVNNGDGTVTFTVKLGPVAIAVEA